jgi:hypothetical protein
MIGDGAFLLLKIGLRLAESAEQPEIRIASLGAILANFGRCCGEAAKNELPRDMANAADLTDLLSASQFWLGIWLSMLRENSGLSSMEYCERSSIHEITIYYLINSTKLHSRAQKTIIKIFDVCARSQHRAIIRHRVIITSTSGRRFRKAACNDMQAFVAQYYVDINPISVVFELRRQI